MSACGYALHSVCFLSLKDEPVHVYGMEDAPIKEWRTCTLVFGMLKKMFYHIVVDFCLT